MADNVNHPPHYNGHASGVECIEIAEHLGFNLGNAFKYVWRAGQKGDRIEDLNKALWYVRRERVRRADLPAGMYVPTPALRKLAAVIMSDGDCAQSRALQAIVDAVEHDRKLSIAETAVLGVIASVHNAHQEAA